MMDAPISSVGLIYMDSRQFDGLARAWATGRTRRSVLSMGGGGALSLVALGETDARKKQRRKTPCPPCKKRKKGKCKKKRPNGTTCPEGTCERGRCVAPRGPNANCPALAGQLRTYVEGKRVAQTFTEPSGGHLVSASLLLRNWLDDQRSVNYELRLNTVDQVSGSPQLTTLALSRLSSSQVSNTTPSWVRFPFSNPPRLSAGVQYALVLAIPGSSGLVGYMVEEISGDPCPGGHLFIADRGEDQPFEPYPLVDIAYQTDTLPPG